MEKWIIGTLLFFLPLLPLASPKRHVVRVAGRWVDLGSVLAEATVSSADECVALCNVTRGCGASVLLSDRCVLHRKHCRCPHDALRPNVSMSSCYVLRRQPLIAISDAWQLAHDDCASLGMYLVAIDSATEQSMIENILMDHGSDCVFTYTSGFSPVPGSLNPTDWRWHPSSYHSQPMTYTHWQAGQPDNFNGNGQDVIGLMARHVDWMYYWVDLAKSHGAKNQCCHVCECSATDCD